jgi:hypothetical protein
MVVDVLTTASPRRSGTPLRAAYPGSGAAAISGGVHRVLAVLDEVDARKAVFGPEAEIGLRAAAASRPPVVVRRREDALPEVFSTPESAARKREVAELIHETAAEARA